MVSALRWGLLGGGRRALLPPFLHPCVGWNETSTCLHSPQLLRFSSPLIRLSGPIIPASTGPFENSQANAGSGLVYETIGSRLRSPGMLTLPSSSMLGSEMCGPYAPSSPPQFCTIPLLARARSCIPHEQPWGRSISAEVQPDVQRPGSHKDFI